MRELRGENYWKCLCGHVYHDPDPRCPRCGAGILQQHPLWDYRRNWGRYVRYYRGNSPWIRAANAAMADAARANAMAGQH
jgi:hypothetical protein